MGNDTVKLPDGRELKNVALLFGNGINRYANPNGGNGWDVLLADMAAEAAQIPHVETDRILSENSVSYPEFYDTVQMRAIQHDEQFNYRMLKPRIASRIEQWQPNDCHERVVEHCRAHHIPFLTTNFDTLMARASDSVQQHLLTANQNRPKPKRQFPIKPQTGRFTDHYLWHCYYSNKNVADAMQQFAIWHIHGVHHYPRSLRLGLTDYIAMTDRAREWLHRSKGNPFNQYSKYDEWCGRGSWLEIFLMKPLVIVGLAMEPSEVGLRWLLIERRKLHRKRPELAQPFYFATVRKMDAVRNGKQSLIESLGGSFIQYPSLSALYEDAFA